MNLNCKVCENPVESDASVKNYCTVCGMGVSQGIFLSGKAFCGQNCLDAFRARGV